MSKEIEFTINPDGTIEADMAGWEGKDCSKAIQELLKKLGTVKETKKKREYFKTTQKVKKRTK